MGWMPLIGDKMLKKKYSYDLVERSNPEVIRFTGLANRKHARKEKNYQLNQHGLDLVIRQTLIQVKVVR